MYLPACTNYRDCTRRHRDQVFWGLCFGFVGFLMWKFYRWGFQR
jgi:hypothetical protein